MRCPGLFFQQAWAEWKMTSEGGVAEEAWGSSECILGGWRAAPKHCAQSPQDSVMKEALPFPVPIGDPLLLWLSLAHIPSCTLEADRGLSRRRPGGASGGLHFHNLDT